MGKNARSSNFELLRIVAMFMIVLYHCLTECMMADPSNRWVLSMYYLSHWGVPVFILLSGYFTIKLSVKRVVDFWLYCAIWMLLSYLFSFAVGNGEWHVVSLLQCLLPISITNLWFVPFYFWLMLLSPLINAGINGLSNRTLCITTIALLLFTLYTSLMWQSPIVNNGKSVVYFITLYLMGALIKRLRIIEKLDIKNIAIGGGILLFAVIALTFIVPMAYQKLLKGLVFFYVSPILLLSSVAVFLLFSKLKIQSRTINYIASSCFAIYLFHENHWTHDFFYGIVGMIIENYSGISQILIVILYAAVLSMLVVVVDKLIREPLSKQVDRIIK